MSFGRQSQPPADSHTHIFDAPIKEPNETVTQTHQHYLVVAAALLTDISNTDADNRYNELVNQWISVIPNQITQQKLRKKRSDLLEERLKGKTNNNEIGKITKGVSIEISGDISVEMDGHKGKEAVHRISAIVPDPCLRLWLEKQNPEMFAEHLDKIPAGDIKNTLQDEYEKQKAEKKSKHDTKKETNGV